MKIKKISWVYITFFIFLLLGIFFLVFNTYQENVRLSLPLYFFLLVICDLGATAFLSAALKSTAEYSGNVLKGNLKLTGPAVIFFVILIIGYKYKPVEKEDPFDLTFILNTEENETTEKIYGSIRIELDNNPRQLPVDAENKVVFNNIDSRYLGRTIPVSSNIPGFRISQKKDTMIKIPQGPLPVIRLSLNKKNDSALFSGYVFKRNPKGPPIPVEAASLHFINFEKSATTDSNGFFRIFLPSKTGDDQNVIIKSAAGMQNDKVILSKNMQVFIDP